MEIQAKTIACGTVLLGALCGVGALAAPLKTGDEVNLWPATAPGSSGLTIKETVTERSKDPAILDRAYTGITKPTLTAYVPTKPNGTALLVAPGGAYMRVVADKEGADIGTVFNQAGVTVFVLKYRLPGEGHANRQEVPLQDAQRAIRTIRKNAADWGLNPARVGVLGLSAGGHLMATLGTRFDKKTYEPVDAADTLNARPDFLALLYPVISMNVQWTHADSRKMLLGDAPSDAQIEAFSAERQVSKAVPPAFIALADDDNGVNPMNSILFYRSLKQSGIPAEMHVFPQSGHGFGIRLAQGAAKQWPKLMLDWMATLGMNP